MATFPTLNAQTAELINAGRAKDAQSTQAANDLLASCPQEVQDLYWATRNSKTVLESAADDGAMMHTAEQLKRIVAKAYGKPELAAMHLRDFNEGKDFKTGREALQRMIDLAKRSARPDINDPKIQAAALIGDESKAIYEFLQNLRANDSERIEAAKAARLAELQNTTWSIDGEEKERLFAGDLETTAKIEQGRLDREHFIEAAKQFGLYPKDVEGDETYDRIQAEINAIQRDLAPAINGTIPVADLPRRKPTMSLREAWGTPNLDTGMGWEGGKAQEASLDPEQWSIGSTKEMRDRRIKDLEARATLIKDNLAYDNLVLRLAQNAALSSYLEVYDTLNPAERELIKRAFVAGQEGINLGHMVAEGGFSEDNAKRTFGATATLDELNAWEADNGRWTRVGNQYLFARIDPAHEETVRTIISLARGRIEEPQYLTDLFNRVGQSFDRTFGNIPRFIAASAKQLGYSIFANEDSYANYAEQVRYEARREALWEAATSALTYDPGYGWFGDAVIGMAEQTPIWLALAAGGAATAISGGAVPGTQIAMGALAMGYAEDTRQQLILDGADPLSALVGGVASGVVQSWIERAQAEALIGKNAVGKFMLSGAHDAKVAIANAFYKHSLREFGTWQFARTAFRLGGGIAANGFLEAVEEGLQAGADRLISDLALGDPNFESALKIGIKEFKDTFATMMVTAGFGGTVRVTRDFAQAASVGKRLRILTGQGKVGERAMKALDEVGKTMDVAALREAWRNASNDRARIKLLMDTGHLPKSQATALHAYLVAEEKIADRHDAIAMQMMVDMSNEGAKTFANDPKAIQRVLQAIGLRNVQVEAAVIGKVTKDNTADEREGWAVTATLPGGGTVTFTVGVMTEQEKTLDGDAATASSAWEALQGAKELEGMTQSQFAERWRTDEAWRAKLIKDYSLARRGETLKLRESPYLVATFTTPDGKTRKRKVSAAGAILLATGGHGRQVVAENKTLAHETLHALVQLLRDTGVLTADAPIVQDLRRIYGDPAKGVDELFNEERFADDLAATAGRGIEAIERAAGEATRRKVSPVARALHGLADLFLGGGDFVLDNGTITVRKEADANARANRFADAINLHVLLGASKQAADVFRATEKRRSLARLQRLREGLHARIKEARENEQALRDAALEALVDSDLSAMAEEAHAIAETDLNATRVSIEQAEADIRENYKGFDPKAEGEAAKLIRAKGRELIAHWRELKNRELELLRELADINIDPGARREYLIASENEEHRLQGRAAREFLDTEKRRINETPVADGDALLANTRAIGHVQIESRESYIRRKMAENGWDRKTAIAQSTHLYPEDMQGLGVPPWASKQLYTGAGGHSPDTAAQALYDEGRIADPTVDAFWDAVRGDIETIGKAKKRKIEAAEAEVASTLEWGKQRHLQNLANIEAQRDWREDPEAARSSIGPGGYIGREMSNRAFNAAWRGLETDAMIAERLGIPYDNWLRTRPPADDMDDVDTGFVDENGNPISFNFYADHEWHHVGRDYREVDFYDGAYPNVNTPTDIEDAGDAEFFWLYTKAKYAERVIDPYKVAKTFYPDITNDPGTRGWKLWNDYNENNKQQVEDGLSAAKAKAQEESGVQAAEEAFVRAINAEADTTHLQELAARFEEAQKDYAQKSEQNTKAFMKSIGVTGNFWPTPARPKTNRAYGITIRSSIGGLYSGGPSAYNRPSLRAIGTNDAGRAYGWGLYATTERDMAEGYAGATWRELANAFRFGGKTYAELTQDDPEAAKLIEGYTATAIAEKRARGYDPEALKRDLQRDRTWLADYLAEPENDPANMATYPQSKQDRLRRFQTRLQNVERLLQADITMTERGTPAVHEQLWWTNRPAGDESHLLTWDARISEENRKRVIEAVRSLGLSDEQLAEHFGTKWSSTPMTGEQAYGFVTEAIRDLAKLEGDAEALASQLLARHDVDGTVRHFPSGGSIYVAFSDEHLQVVRRWLWDEATQAFALDRSFTPPPPTMPEARSSIGGFVLSERARAEMDEVRRQYEGTDQWMKAPNGKPTKLTRRLWLLVRTPAFKRWFGDWENDPANASKVVDENGEPLVVYHGSENAGFTTFDSDYWDEGTLGNFTSSEVEIAETYSGSSLLIRSDMGQGKRQGNYALFLNIRNPLIVDAQGNYWDEIPPENRDDYVGAGELTDEQLETLAERAGVDEELERDEDGELTWQGRNDLVESVESAYAQDVYDSDGWPTGETESPIFNSETLEATSEHRIADSTRKIANRTLKDGTGYDGVIFRDIVDIGPHSRPFFRRESDVFVTKGSTQLKSATDNVGTFDPENPDIRSSITGTAIPSTKFTIAEARQAIRDQNEKNPKGYTNRQTGHVAFINGHQINEMTNAGSMAKTKNNGFTIYEHLHAVAKAPTLYENATLVRDDPDTKNGDKNVRILRYAAPIVIERPNGPIEATAWLTVKTSERHGHRIYSLEVLELEEARQRSANTASSALPRARNLTDTIAYPPEEVNTEIDPQATSARQKDAHGVYPDASGDIARSSIGGRRQTEYRGIIAKHRPNLPQAEVDRFMEELGKLGAPKAEKAALHWFIKGALELPEDEEKLKQTLAMAEKFKLDPLQFDSPAALAEEADRRNPKKQKVGYIDPDTVPELTNKRDLGNGLVIYDVEDSEAGQAAMRRIMNSHLGRNARGEYWSPWCLLTPTVSGGVSESAKRHWAQYNKSGRGAAFYKGKLVSFQSSKFPQGPEWWDMEDKSHRQWVPYTETVSAHEVGWDDVPTEAVVQVESETNMDTAETRRLDTSDEATVGDKQNGVWQLWVENAASKGHYLYAQETYKDGHRDGPVITYIKTSSGSIIHGSYQDYKEGKPVGQGFRRNGVGDLVERRMYAEEGMTQTKYEWGGEATSIQQYIGDGLFENAMVRNGNLPNILSIGNGKMKGGGPFLIESWRNARLGFDQDLAIARVKLELFTVEERDGSHQESSLGYVEVYKSGAVYPSGKSLNIHSMKELQAFCAEHGIPLTQRTLDRLDAFQRGDIEALRIKDPFAGVPLPDVSAYEQGGARSSIGGHETLRLPRETEAEARDPRAAIGGIERGARAASLYFGRQPSYRDLNSKVLTEAALFATGKRQTGKSVQEAYQSFGVNVTPEAAAVIADRINDDLKEQAEARRRRTKGEQPRDRAFGLVDALAKAYDANWAEAQKEAFEKGVAGTFGAARQMAEDIQTLMEARRQEAEAVTGTAPAVLETEMGFDIEATLLAAPEQVKTPMELEEAVKKAQAELDEATREAEQAEALADSGTEQPLEALGFTEAKLDELRKRRRELRDRLRKLEKEREEARKAAKRKYAKKETTEEQNAEEDDKNYRDYCEKMRVTLNGVAFDLDDAPSVREFVNLIILHTAERRAGHEIAKLQELREALRDPLVVRDAARTLAQIAQDLANRLVPSAARELIVKKAMTLAAAETIGQVRALATGALLSIRNVRIRQGRTELRDAMVKMIQSVKGRGRTVVGKEDSERKVSGDLERWLEDIEKALTLGEAALESMRTAAYATIVGLSEHGKTQKELVDFRDYMKAMRTISAIDKFGSWRHMTLAGLDDLRVELERMINGGLEAHERKMRQMEAKINGFVQPLIDAMTQHAPDFKPDENAPLRERIANFLDRHLGLQSLLFEALIGNSTGETRQKATRAVRDLLNEFAAASAKYEATLLQWRTEIQGIATKYYGSTRAFMERMHTPVPEDLRAHLTNRRTDAQEQAGREARQKTRITYGQALQLYASLVQRDYAQNARIHHRDGADFDALRRNLTDADVAFIAECSRFMQRIFPDLQAEYAEVTGVTVGTTPNYWPVKIDYPRSGLSAEVRAWTPIVAAMEPRRRNGLDFKEEVSAEQMLFGRLDEWARMLAYGKLGIISAAVFGNGDVINAIKNSLGTKMALRIQENIKTALMGPATKGDNLVILATRLASAFAMAANVGVAFKQFAGIPAFALKLGTKETVAAWWGGVTRLADAEWDADWAILTASDSYKARYGGAGLNAEMRAALQGATPGAVGGATAKAYDLGFRLQSVADRVVAKPFAIHAFRMYREAYLREGLTAAEAQRRAVIDAWALVEDTQQSARPENQLQSVNTSRIIRMLTQFRSSQLQQLQWEMRAWAAFLRGEEGAKQKLARVIFINHILAPLFWTAFDALWQAALGLLGPGDEDDEEKMERRRERRLEMWISDLALGAILGQLTAVPVLGGSFVAVYNRIVSNVRSRAEGKEPKPITTTEIVTEVTDVPAIRSAADIMATVYNLGLAATEVEMRDVASEADDFLKTAIPPYRDISKGAEQWGLGDLDNLWEEEE